jgi:uncharacterized membrane protein
MPVSYHFDQKRFEIFIDAIIAILLTILVLDIKIPEDKIENASTYAQVKTLTPIIVSYLASFMLIVGFWIDYHLLFVNITHITKRFILLNMLFIFSISFAPFVTAFAGKHFRDAFAVALLSATYCIMNFFFMLIFLYAKSKNLTDPAFWKASKGTAFYSAIGVFAILAAIPLAYVNTFISFAIFLITFGWHLMKKRWY